MVVLAPLKLCESAVYLNRLPGVRERETRIKVVSNYEFRQLVRQTADSLTDLSEVCFFYKMIFGCNPLIKQESMNYAFIHAEIIDKYDNKKSCNNCCGA
jgi:hypothetical protein